MNLIVQCQSRNKLSFILISIFIAVTLAFTGCVTNSSSVFTPESASTTPLESEPTPRPVNIRIDYIGVENAYGGNVQLVVVTSDGDKIEKYSVPRDDEYYTMSNFEVKRIGRRIFHAADLKGDLKLNLLAYHRDQSKKTNLELINMMEWYYGDSINMLKNLVLSMPENDKLIGEYEYTWYSDESIDIGQHHEISSDLHVWYSIWLDTEPAVISEPLLVPDVRIQSVSIPSEVKPWTWSSHTLMLVNNENHDITVEWQAYSSITGNFDGGDVIVPGYNHVSIKKQYLYDKIGSIEITYKVFYKGTELDSWSGTLNVAP